VNTYCEYYQAKVDRKKAWFISACIRSEGEIAIARAIKKDLDIFEFFVPVDQEEQFVSLMNKFLEKKIIFSFEKLKNRFLK
jgi:hypothetical protein